MVPGQEMIIPGSEILVEKDKIAGYFHDPELVAQLNFFYRYKVMGWPYSGGWAEQPAKFVDVVETLEVESGKRLKAKTKT